MLEKDILLIINPNASKGRGRKRAQEIKDSFKAYGRQCTVAYTRGPGHASLLARKGVLYEYRVIIAAGGDGCVNEVVSGIMEDGAKVRMGVIPIGRGNDFAWVAGIPRKLDEAGVILGSRLVVNPKMMGFDVCAHVSITLRDPKLLSEAIEELKKVPEIVECHFITGAGNILVKLYCVDNEHLMRTIFDGILRIPGVATTQTYISLDESFQREPYIDYLDNNK